jgi:hypothetical protein
MAFRPGTLALDFRAMNPAPLAVVALAVAVAGPSGSAAVATAQDAGCSTTIEPAGANLHRFHRQVFCIQPMVSDIGQDEGVRKALYSGKWYTKKPIPASAYDMADGALRLSLGGSLATVDRASRPGTTPLLPARTGFYVEFAVRLSDNDSDHWPAVWLMPVEHDARQSDHDLKDPPRFERWTELDVDEGGFNPGLHGALIAWSGKWPKYKRSLQANNVRWPPLDRTREHLFGMAFDPVRGAATWWLDDQFVGRTDTSAIPSITLSHNYYVNIDAQSHGQAKPYFLFVRYVRAFAP